MLGLRDAVRNPRRVRWRDTWLYMQRSGHEALPIVSLISFLMGLITAFQAAVQLRQFGADIYVANLVGLSITRELGPLMTAIIAAGRSGAAFAAEIGTMKVSEEVDALAAMGLDRTRFLVTPKVVALLIMLPCLTLFADLVGILGGLFVAMFSLDIPAVVYFRQMKCYMAIWDVGQGLVKAVVFAMLIAGDRLPARLRGARRAPRASAASPPRRSSPGSSPSSAPTRCSRCSSMSGEAHGAAASSRSSTWRRATATTMILHDVSCEVRRGEVFVIVGGSGCGKTTLLRHMIGLLRPAAGRVLIEGEDITAGRRGAAAAHPAQARRDLPGRRAVRLAHPRARTSPCRWRSTPRCRPR